MTLAALRASSHSQKGREQAAGCPGHPGLTQEGPLHFINRAFKHYPAEMEMLTYCSWEHKIVQPLRIRLVYTHMN